MANEDTSKQLPPSNRMRKPVVPVAGVHSPGGAPVILTPEQWQEEQNEKQKSHGAAVKRMLDARKAEKARKEMALRRGVVQMPDELSEAVNARMSQQDIPTKGNT